MPPAVSLTDHPAFYRILVNTSPNGMLYLSMKGEIAFANPRAAELFGVRDPAHLLGINASACVRPEDLPRAEADVRCLLDAGVIRLVQYELLRRDGGTFSADISAAIVRDEHGAAPLGVAAVIRDTTAQQAAASAFRLMFLSNPLPMWVYDAETLAFVEVNDAAVAHYGYSRDEFLAMRILDIRPEEDRAALEDHLATQRGPFRRAGVWRHRRRDGQIIDVEIHSHAFEWKGRRSVLVVALDMTAQHRLEQQLRQAQKMEAVGRLAGGVAHDFNNVLTAVLGYCGLLLTDPRLPLSLRDDIQQIESAGQLAASLTQQLLAFSRRQIVQPVPLDVAATLRRLENMLQRLIGEDVRVVLQMPERIRPIHIDPGQFEQIAINLAVNARDAMPRGGVLTVEAAEVHLDERYAEQHAAVQPGDYVMLAISDTGTGMTPDVQARVFEPFFTTKELGKGTGLGLATVYGIVKQNGGNIWVYSEPGHGTTFKIYLPVLRDSAGAVALASARTARPAGTEIILVVEDDVRTQELARRGLERFGYTVLTAQNGEGALKVAEGHPGRIDLLLTDVVMPGMSGKTLADLLTRARPGIRVLFCSGYTENAIVHHDVLDPGIEFLQKPYTPDVLARRVRDILDTPRDPR